MEVTPTSILNERRSCPNARTRDPPAMLGAGRNRAPTSVPGHDLAQRPFDALNRVAHAGDDLLILRGIGGKLNALQGITHMVIEVTDHLQPLGDVLTPLALAVQGLH